MEDEMSCWVLHVAAKLTKFREDSAIPYMSLKPGCHYLLGFFFCLLTFCSLNETIKSKTGYSDMSKLCVKLQQNCFYECQTDRQEMKLFFSGVWIWPRCELRLRRCRNLMDIFSPGECAHCLVPLNEKANSWTFCVSLGFIGCCVLVLLINTNK